MKKAVLILFFLFFLCNAQAQHSYLYSQYMFNGLIINPAYAGANKVLDITLLHRNQWTGFDGAPKTTSISANTPLKNKKLNLGISYVSDHYGVTQKNIVKAMFAYRILFKKSSISFGLQGGADFTYNNWNAIQTTVANDNSFIGQGDRFVLPLAGFGMYYQSPKFYAGLSSPTIIQLKKGQNKTFRPFFITCGYLFNLSDDIKLKPSILLKYIQHSPVQTDFNLNGYYKSFGLGFSYRTNDAVVFMMQYQINEQLSAGYSYDLTISKLSTFNKGSHELMLKYQFGYKVNVSSPRYF